MLVSIWGGSVPAQLCLPLTRAGTSSPAVLQGGGKGPGWQKQQRVELHIPVGTLDSCLDTLWFPLLPQTPQTGPSGHTCQGRSESMGWEDEHSLNLHHSPCPVLLLLVGIQMNKNALPQA